MKKIKFNLIVSLVILIIVIGCSDNLERFPYDSIVSDKAFETFEDAKKWNNTFNSDIRGRVSGSVIFTPDLQVDQLNATKDFGNRNGSAHRWTNFLAADGAISGAWRGYYSRIRNINVALAGFEGFSFDDPSEVTSLKTFKGNAYFSRAFYYFQLVNRFAKTYNPSTADTDLGVPLILEFDVNAKPPRNTVKEVYTQILSDLQLASNALSNEAGVQGANYFNKDVIKAFEARIKLNMQDWSGAKAAADFLINSGKYPLINTEAGLIDMWTNDFAQEVIYQPFLSAPDELTNNNGAIYLGYDSSSNTYSPDFLPSQWVVDMYDDLDHRKKAYFDQSSVVRIDGQDFTGIYLVNKFPGNPALFTGSFTNYQNAPKVFRIAEMYLISTEAALNISGSDAATPLNALRTARGITTIPNPIFQDLKDERFRELAFEGFRLDDLRRWGDGFTRKDPQNTATINVGSEYDILSKDASDPKFVWGIPSRDLTTNPGLKGQQNPGW